MAGPERHWRYERETRTFDLVEGSRPDLDGPDFLRLANALSALYPKDREKKRLLDAMLLAMPR
jgi:hypothetical protein